MIPATEAFRLLMRGAAEVVDVEADRQFSNYDFASWTELSQFKESYEQSHYRWIQCVRGVLAVPGVVRLLKFDRDRRQHIRFVVIDRKVTQGTKGEIGKQWCEQIWTTLATCRQRGKQLYHFLVEAIQANLGIRHCHPSLNY